MIQEALRGKIQHVVKSELKHFYSLTLQVSSSRARRRGVAASVIELLVCISRSVRPLLLLKLFLLELMNVCKLCVSIFYLFFFFSNKKASKTRKDMQGIHEGTGALLLPTLLAAVPSSIPVLLYLPRPRVQQHVPSALSCTPSSLCFLLF